MRQFELMVVEIAAAGGLIQVACAGPEPGASAGRVCLALASLPEHPPLRLPLYLLRRPDGAPVFWVPPTHPYARLQPGDRLDVIGPCGRGFKLPAGSGHLLVIAASLERLLPAIHASLAARLAVTVMTPRSASLLPADVEIHRGALTAELAAWADVVVLDMADPRARAEHLRALAPGKGGGFVQALFSPPMPCGTGACQACWVETLPGRAPRLACVDGPVFFF